MATVDMEGNWDLDVHCISFYPDTCTVDSDSDTEDAVDSTIVAGVDKVLQQSLMMLLMTLTMFLKLVEVLCQRIFKTLLTSFQNRFGLGDNPLLQMFQLSKL